MIQPHPPFPTGIHVGSRRWFLKTGSAAMASLPLATLEQVQANTQKSGSNKSVILFWLMAFEWKQYPRNGAATGVLFPLAMSVG